MAEPRTERAVADGAADLEQQVGAAAGPAHLLRLGHAPVDQEVGRAFRDRRADPQAGPVPFGVVDQPGALAAEVAVHRAQRPPQLASGLARPAATAPEGGQERADALEGDPGIPGLRRSTPASAGARPPRRSPPSPAADPARRVASLPPPARRAGGAWKDGTSPGSAGSSRRRRPERSAGRGNRR